MYRDINVCIQPRKEKISNIHTMKGVRQGCGLLPLLPPLYVICIWETLLDIGI